MDMVILLHQFHPVNDVFRFSLPEKNLIALDIMYPHVFAFEILQIGRYLPVFHGKFPGCHHAVGGKVERPFVGFKNDPATGNFHQLSGTIAVGIRHLAVGVIAEQKNKKCAQENPENAAAYFFGGLFGLVES